MRKAIGKVCKRYPYMHTSVMLKYRLETLLCHSHDMP